MVLSRRERLVSITAAAAVVLLGLDRFALEPFFQQRDQLQSRIDKARTQLARCQTVISRSRQATGEWRDRVSAGLRSDPADAESQILHALRRWAEEARLNLSLLKPDRLPQKGRLGIIAFQASGTGRLDGVRRLLWQVQTSSLPLRVTEVQITSRKDGSDDLTFQLRLSTLYVPPERPAGSSSNSSRPAQHGGS